LNLERDLLRARDVKDAITSVRGLLASRTYSSIGGDQFARAALERFVEIIGEAARHLPDSWKAEHPAVNWRAVADMGNVLRHAYRSVDLKILWDVYERDLGPSKPRSTR
jgi:uncharacterized protein with HEPN domain